MNSLFMTLIVLMVLSTVAHIASGKPNVLMIIADDLGIGDLGCYGNLTLHTPAIDRLAREGSLLTHHLAAASLCTPSRAALMTARYPARYGLTGSAGTPPVIVHVASRVALPLDEPTLGRAFSAAGYKTHFTGKWHLGSLCTLLGRHCFGPLRYGFNSTFYLPMSLRPTNFGQYSFWILPENESLTLQAAGFSLLATLLLLLLLKPRHYSAGILLLSNCFASWLVLSHYRLHTSKWHQVSNWVKQNLDGVVLNGSDIVLDQPIDLDTLNHRMTVATMQFIREQSAANEPFLAVHSFAHVHTPLVTAAANRGRSKHGRYGDAVEEMDEAVGSLLALLDELSLTQNTIVYFVSDHGGHLESLGEDGQRTGGFNSLFKGGKSHGAMEGGIRVPGIVRYPGVVSAGQLIHVPTSLLDAVPTLLQLAQLPSLQELLPGYAKAKDVDGLSFAPLLMNANDSELFDGRIFLHHGGRRIHALRLVTGEPVRH